MSRTVDSEISNFKSGSVPTGYKHTEVGVIPEEWEAAHIGDVCSFAGGSQPPRSTFRFTPTPGYIRLIQIRDYKSDDFASYIPEALARKRCTSEDIMIGRYGPPVFQILRGLAGAYNVALIKTTLSQKVDREFFFNVLSQDPLFQLIDALSRRSSGQTGVEMPALKTYGLPLPPLAEQRVIATALSDVDGLLGGLDRLIAKKRDLKQAAMQQLLTGQTRLPGFHGQWELKRLGEVIDFANGKPHEDDIDSTGEFYLITLDSIGIDGKLKGEHRPIGFCDGSLAKDDIVTILSDIAHGNLLGLCDLIPEDNRYVLNQRVGRLRVKPDIKASPAFLRLQINRHQEHFKKRGQGTSQRHIYRRDFDCLELNLPTNREQTAIAEVLSEMDAEIAALEQRREKTRVLKQGMMQELLTGRIRLV